MFSVASLGHKRGSSTNENTPWLNSPENSYYTSKYHSEMEVWRGIEESNAVIIFR